MRISTVVRATVISTLLVAVSSVQAGPLGVDPAGIPAFTGTAAFNATDGGVSLLVDVDYAVFEPGAFTGADPSGGADYVYAYQAFNIGGGDATVMSGLTVGVVPGLVTPGSAGDDAGYPMAGGISPSLAAVGVDSVLYTFVTPQIAPSEYSSVVFFTSPVAPVWGVGSVIDGGLSDQQPVPTVPEPTTLGLLGMAGLALLRRRR